MRSRRVPAPSLVLGAAVSVQIGAAVAKSLFDELPPPAVVLLRLVFGGATVWALVRPQLRGRATGDRRLAVALGLVIACMNLSFYEALDRVPLGIAVTVEFLGPLVVAVVASRRARDVVWIALAAIGIALLARGRGRGIDLDGVGLAALAGVFWGTYIVLGTRLGKAWSGASGLAVAMAVGAVVTLPWGVVSGAGGLTHPRLLAEGAAVGVLCSAVPWSLEIEAMRRLPTHVFGVLMSVEPAIAAVCGFALLGERLRTRAIVAVALVTVASAGAALDAQDPEVPLDA